jgi:hypothetical protein
MGKAGWFGVGFVVGSVGIWGIARIAGFTFSRVIGAATP